MKKTLFFIAAMFLFSFGFCQPKISVQSKKLTQILANTKDTLKLFKEYVEKIKNGNSIKTESEIKEIFALRDSLKKRLVPPLSRFYDPSSPSCCDSVVVQELKSLGFQEITVEGMFMALGQLPVLQDKINEVASEPYYLYLNFMNAKDDADGSEYTFMDLIPEMEMLRIGETLQTKFPNSEYSQKIKELFYAALYPMVDFHKVVSKDMSQFIVGSTLTDVFPTGTEVSNYENFVKNYSKTRYAKIVAKILANTSEIRFENEKVGDIYLVSVKVLTGTFDDAWKICCSEYLDKGIDIPHLISVSETEIAICYRFFSDKTKAEKAKTDLKKNYNIDAKTLILNYETGKVR